MNRATWTTRAGRVALVGFDHTACRDGHRRAAAFSLAFLLLGGRRAANLYLDTLHPGLASLPRQRAGGSALGLIEVSRKLRRDAMMHFPSGSPA